MMNLRTKSRCLLLGLTLLSMMIDLGNGQSIDEIFQMDQEAYNKEKTKPVNLPAQNSSYDFIIVGAGPAGCVIANRLSAANPNWTILVLEAGATETILNDLPVLTSTLPLTHNNWNYTSTPQENACQGMENNICQLPRGRGLGGSSKMNFMLYTRGNAEDYDLVARAGNTGWSYREMLPLFLRSEKAISLELQRSPYHNTTGEQPVEYPKYRTRMAEAFVRGSEQMGYPENDYNGESQTGTSFVQSTNLNGHRHSAAKSFLLPIIDERENLDVLTFAHVTKILLDVNFTAYGVNYNHRGKNYTVKAKKEVILCAGAFNSPQLLLLSGIGPKADLVPLGIEPLVEVPVGKIMYEHMAHFGPTFTTNSTGSTLFNDRITEDDLQRYKNGDPATRVSTLGGIEAFTFFKFNTSDPEMSRPDMECVFVSGSLASDSGTGLKESAGFRDEIYDVVYKPLADEEKEHFTLVLFDFHPLSTGTLKLRDSNPFSPPIIDPNYYANDADIEVMLAGIKEAIRIAETPAMKSINATIHAINVPGCEDFEFGTDDYWRCSIKVLSYTIHHQVASCKMGTFDDSTAVVSPELKVHGMFNLRVADPSIFPIPPSAHTNAISLVIGEKASEMIISQWMNNK